MEELLAERNQDWRDAEDALAEVQSLQIAYWSALSRLEGCLECLVGEDSVVELNGTDNYEGVSVYDLIDQIEQANSGGEEA